MSTTNRTLMIVFCVVSCASDEPTLGGLLYPCTVDADCEDELRCVDVNTAQRCSLECDDDADCSSIDAQCDEELGVCAPKPAPAPY